MKVDMAGQRTGRRRWLPVRRRDGEGGYSIVEAVITLPALILFVFTVVQYGLVWHARHVAEAAAQDGLRAARAYQATTGDGQAAAADYLHQVAPRLLTSTDVSVTRSTTTVTVRVRGQVLSAIPGAHFTVNETVTGPVERFVAPGA
jgi:Flp pilus assembly protein TadG